MGIPFRQGRSRGRDPQGVAQMAEEPRIIEALRDCGKPPLEKRDPQLLRILEDN